MYKIKLSEQKTIPVHRYQSKPVENHPQAVGTDLILVNPRSHRTTSNGEQMYIGRYPKLHNTLTEVSATELHEEYVYIGEYQ